jgi:hypothetical protein
MGVTGNSDVQTWRDDTVRLRLNVYDPLAAAKGADTVLAQAKLHGVHRATMFGLRRGNSPTLRLAMRIANDLGVKVEDVFERVA